MEEKPSSSLQTVTNPEWTRSFAPERGPAPEDTFTRGLQCLLEPFRGPLKGPGGTFGLSDRVQGGMGRHVVQVVQAVGGGSSVIESQLPASTSTSVQVMETPGVFSFRRHE